MRIAKSIYYGTPGWEDQFEETEVSEQSNIHPSRTRTVEGNGDDAQQSDLGSSHPSGRRETT